MRRDEEDVDGKMKNKAVTVGPEHYKMAREMGFELGRQDPVTGRTNFSGVVRDGIEALHQLYNSGKLKKEDFFDEDGEPWRD